MARAPLSWIEIDRRALLSNLAAFRRRVGPQVALCPVVKANAYGHGMREVATLCAPKAAFLAENPTDPGTKLGKGRLADIFAADPESFPHAA